MSTNDPKKLALIVSNPVKPRLLVRRQRNRRFSPESAASAWQNEPLPYLPTDDLPTLGEVSAELARLRYPDDTEDAETILNSLKALHRRFQVPVDHENLMLDVEEFSTWPREVWRAAYRKVRNVDWGYSKTFPLPKDFRKAAGGYFKNLEKRIKLLSELEWKLDTIEKRKQWDAESRAADEALNGPRRRREHAEIMAKIASGVAPEPLKAFRSCRQPGRQFYARIRRVRTKEPCQSGKDG
jgi:hypothetical protein